MIQRDPAGAGSGDRPTQCPGASERAVMWLLLFLVVSLALLHFPLVFRLNINWDEFRFLSDVYRFQAGTLASPLQTFHVHLFGWLPHVGANEVDQVLGARVAYYALFMGSASLLFSIARWFLTNAAALFVLLCYLAYAEVIRHATSFRFDGLAVFFLLGALVFLMGRRSRWKTAVAAALVAMAFLVTVKTIFYAPTLGLALLLGHRTGAAAPGSVKKSTGHEDPADAAGSGSGAAELARFTLCLAVVLTGLFLLHRASLSPTAEPLAVWEAGPRVIRLDRLFPARQYFYATVILNVVIWYLLAAGAVTALLRWWKGERHGQSRRWLIMLFGLLLPLGSLVIYRNAFPYYYAFIMPPALILCGLPFDELLRASRTRHRVGAWIGLAVTVGAVLITFGVHYRRYLPPDIDVQRQVVEAVHEIFPEPVPYLDRGSMIASFPSAGFFMSTLGFERYLATGKPSFDVVLREDNPVFVLANHPALVLDADVSGPAAPGPDRLREEDFRVLQDNFIHHWGPIWVAGKKIPAASQAPYEFEILIPGMYTLEAGEPVFIDGSLIEPESVVFLTPERHSMRVLQSEGTIILRWGEKLVRPMALSEGGVLFRDFHENAGVGRSASQAVERTQYEPAGTLEYGSRRREGWP